MSTPESPQESGQTPPEPPAEPAKQGGLRRVQAPADGPHAAELRRAAAAFNAGDFREAGHLARAVLGDQPAEDEAAFARELLRRIQPDPLALGVGLACAVLLLIVVYLAFAR